MLREDKRKDNKDYGPQHRLRLSLPLSLALALSVLIREMGSQLPLSLSYVIQRVYMCIIEKEVHTYIFT